MASGEVLVRRGGYIMALRGCAAGEGRAPPAVSSSYVGQPLLFGLSSPLGRVERRAEDAAGDVFAMATSSKGYVAPSSAYRFSRAAGDADGGRSCADLA